MQKKKIQKKYYIEKIVRPTQGRNKVKIKHMRAKI